MAAPCSRPIARTTAGILYGFYFYVEEKKRRKRTYCSWFSFDAWEQLRIGFGRFSHGCNSSGESNSIYDTYRTFWFLRHLDFTEVLPTFNTSLYISDPFKILYFYYNYLKTLRTTVVYIFWSLLQNPNPVQCTSTT